MKSIIILLLFILQLVALPQNNFIQQITSGDFDARNPFIYKEKYGFYHDMFFELHKNGTSNIYSIKYNFDTKLFGDTIALTSSNSLNINPSFSPNAGLLFQTNRNGNWDIALLTDSNNVWGDIKFLTDSSVDEISPKFFESTNVFPPDSTRILFKRGDDIVFLSYKQNQIIENILFKDNTDITYSDYVGYATDIWSSNSGYHVFAIEDSLGYKKIVRRYKSYNNNLWQEKIIVKDSCDCDDLSIQMINYNFAGIFYSDTLLTQRRFFTIQNPFVFNASSELVEIRPEGNLAHLDIYLFLIVTKRSQILSPKLELYDPHTYIVEQNGISKIRVDVSDLGFWDKDSLIQVAIPNPGLAIGPVGLKDGLLTIYTVWEDSVNGHIQLFGTPRHIMFGAVENESFANDFILYQNYPNPFNPSTTISWQSTVGSHQTLKVFDVLGREVATLMDEYRNAGSYKVEFDASSFPSGIYFYKIQSGSFISVKKMIFLK